MNQLPVGTILFDGVSKRYRLGELGTLRGAVEALAHRVKGGVDLRDLWALKDVSFRVEPGDSLGVIGPNGAGKTTTLRLLSKITQPSSGHISVSGRTSSLIELGAGFHPDLTGRENVFLNGAILGLKRREIRRKLDSIIAFSELERFIDTPVKRYSSGMYVRLGFAVAAHVEPDVLLIDEVLAVGDASFRHKCMLRMQELQQNGTSILFVSHNMHMMRKTCRQSLVLVGGRCLSLGDTDDVITTYEKHLASRGNSTSSARTDAGDELDGQSLRLTGIHLSQADGLPSQGAVPIQSEKPATIRITYQSARPQQIGRLDVRIVRDDGTLCCAVDGSLGMGHDGERLDEIGGQGEFRVTLDPFQLTTGRYSVFVEISDPTDSTALVSGQSGYFGVFTQRALPNPGVFVPRTFFEHYRLREVDAAGEREPAEPETGVVDRR